jgi:hypothetical protein
MSAPYSFDVAAFRQKYPVFSNPLTYPDATLQQYWDNATCYVENTDYLFLRGDCRVLALNLMTAHLAAIATLIPSGQISALVQGATIDKISVTLTPPPLKTQWQWWLSTTPYGQQLLALLQAKSVGGMYIPSTGALVGFRNKWGGFC